MKRENITALWVAANTREKEREYWLKKFSAFPGKTVFPYDFKEKASNGETVEPGAVKFAFPGMTAKRLSALSTGSTARLYLVLAAGVVVLLGKYTGNRDITVGSPIFKPKKSGDFLNTVLPLRNETNPSTTFKDLLRQVRQTAAAADENRDYPLEILLRQLHLPGSPEEFPLFDVALLVDTIQHIHHLKETNPHIIFSFSPRGETINGTLFYNPLLYEKTTAERIAAHLVSLCGSLVFNPDLPLSEVELITASEKEQVLYEFNRTQTPYPRDETIDRLFAAQSRETPHHLALIGERATLTYKKLAETAAGLARCLREKGVNTGDAVGIMTASSPETVIALLAVLQCGGVYLPLNPDYPLERKMYILADSRANIVLSNYPGVSFAGREVIDLANPGQYCLEAAVKPPHRADDAAYIMYTSGSSGQPKGVLVEHRSVIRLVKNTNFIEFKTNQRILQTGALEFDASTFEIWGALLNGLALCLVNKEKRMNPGQLKQILKKLHINILWMTSALFNWMSQEDIDVFPSLENLLVGGDILSISHIRGVRNRYPRLRVINGYGPTENTTFSTTHLIAGEYRHRVPIGAPIANSTVYIIGSDLHPAPIGVPGELWVGGDGVARGYLNNPELTHETFYQDKKLLRGVQGGGILEKSPHGSRRLYRTGDLACWLPDGTIDFLGRMDQQVKIRGYRIEPGEIETRLLKYPQVKEAVILSREHEGDKHLCAYIAAAGGIDLAGLKDQLSRVLPGYMIPAYFIRVDKIPLTSNGKVDRNALPGPGPTGVETAAAPRDETEEKLAQIWSRLLHLEKEKIGIHHSFFELGGHSLKAAALISQIHEVFQAKVPLAEIFITPTIRELARYIKGTARDTFTPIDAVEKREYYVLSPAQKRMYILQQMEVDSIAYNIPAVIPLAEAPDPGKLAKTFAQLINRHESLRTSFHLVDDRPVQRVHEQVPFEIENFLAAGSTGSHHSFVRPFDLSRAPLLRLELQRIPGQDCLLLVDMHHIISDGISHQLLQEDFPALYLDEKLPPLRIQYKDFAQWQNCKEQGENLKHQEAYWRKKFAGDIPVLNLANDYPRPALQSYDGDAEEFEISAEATAALEAIALSQGSTLFMVLLAVTNVLLYRLSSQEDIVIGTPIAARRHADLEKIVGMFVNTLALRNCPSGEKKLKEFLQEVKDHTLEAFENQEYPFEDLVEKLAVNRDPSRNPLFDVMVELQNIDLQHDPDEILTGSDNDARVKTAELPKDKNNADKYIWPVSKFDLTFNARVRGKRLIVNIEYCTRLFKRETIIRYCDYFKKIAAALLADPGTRLADIEIISAEERQQVLYNFNDTGTGYPRDKTFPDLMVRQVKKTPDYVAIIGKEQGAEDNRTISISYRELNERSDCLAHRLKEKGVEADTIVGLRIKRSIEMITAVLGIWKAGGAYLPIDPEYPEERIDYMMKDSNAGLLLTSGTLVEKGEHPVLDYALPPAITAIPANLAYIIYTSGSTGKPKGVLVNQGNLVAYVDAFLQEFDPGPTDTVIVEASFTFDAFVEEAYPVLLRGGKLCIAQIYDVMDVHLLREFITRNNITIISCSPLLLNELNKLERVGCIHTFISGADVLKGEYVDYLCTIGRVYNTYGPTETTVCATYYRVPGKPGPNIPIGKPIANYQVYIVDKHNKLQAPGIIGELWIGGEGVGRGYLNNPELTAERFITGLNKHHYPPSPLYYTGDLGRWRPDGNIEFCGRLDHQVKIRGFRIEVGEIEIQLQRSKKIKESLVLDKTDETGGKYLCAYIVPHQPGSFNPAELKEFLSQSLPGYMLPSYFIPLEKIPITPNGKIDRKSLPLPEVVAGTKYAAPRNEIEKKLVQIWSGTLARDANHASQLCLSLGIDDHFFKMGGHSLKATVMVSRIHKEFQVRLPLAEVFKTPTIRGLAQYLKEATGERYFSIEPVEEKEYYELSSAQKRIYVLQQMEYESTAYNMPVIIPLGDETDHEKLAKAFNELIRRHESLRTSFHMIGNQPVQRVHGEAAFEFEMKASGQEAGKQRGQGDGVTNFIRPFDLSRPPLLRAGLSADEGQNRCLLVDLHHIITDGVSMDILEKEFHRLYENESVALSPLRIRYRDFSAWQNRLLETELMKKQESYWLKTIAGEIPVLTLPYDYPRPLLQGFAGAAVNFVLDGHQSRELKRIGQEADATLYMSILSVYMILLAKLSGQDDIIVGAPVAGRRHADLENVMGMFVNTLPVRNYPAGHKTYAQFLVELKKAAVEVFENQEYPFETLVEKAVVRRDTSRNPVFDVIFNLLNLPGSSGAEDIPAPESPASQAGGDEGEAGYEHRPGTAKFDLNLAARDFSGGEGTKTGLQFSLEYSTRLFNAGTIERFIGYFKRIVKTVTEHPQVKIADIEILDKDERYRLLETFNRTSAPYPQDKTIHRLFTEQVEVTPDRIALLGDDKIPGNRDENARPLTTVFNPISISYRELEERAHRLAGQLKAKGVQADTSVAIMMERSLEMGIGILGILKAGGAYMPIDPGYPPERSDYMLKDSNARVLVSTPALEETIKTLNPGNGKENIEILYLSPLVSPSPPTSHCPGIPTLHSSSLAYIIYTSGSTGSPKGVLVEHRSVIRLVKNTNFIEFQPEHRILQTGALEFDASTFEIWGALLNGLVLCLVSKEKLLNPGQLKETLRKHDIGILWMTSALFNWVSQEDIDVFSGLKNLLVGGDVLSLPHIARVRGRYPHLRVINGYGPTENTTFSTTHLIDRDYRHRIPIGAPIANSTVYIIGSDFHLAPVGVPGELWVGGDGVARGYLNNPELTHETFYQDKKLLRGVQGGGILEKSPPGSRRLYRTGDLACWLPDGTIEFLGRMDQQVKIRGYRIEPGEIENHLLKFSRVKEAAVLSREHEGDKYLCAYIVTEEKPDISRLKDELARVIPDYMIPSYFIRVEKIPLTPNGKVDRSALPEPGSENVARAAAPRDETEEKLLHLWSEILGRDAGHVSQLRSTLGIDDNFFERGGHSLKAMMLISQVHKVFQVKLPLEEVFTNPTIKGLSRCIKRAAGHRYVSIEPVEEKEYYELSSAQKRIYVLQQMEYESTAYNIPVVIPLAEAPDLDKLAKIFEKLINRHESLRTSFHMIDDRPVQRVQKQAPFEIEHLLAAAPTGEDERRRGSRETRKAGGENDHTYEFPKSQEPRAKSGIYSVVRPFDLSRAPLLRVALQCTTGQVGHLLVDMHHIISDGVSHQVLQEEFMALYCGNPLAMLRIQYKDFAQWQNSEAVSNAVQHQEKFWLKEFQGEIPRLSLPLDYPRPEVQTFQGTVLSFEVPAEIGLALTNLALQTASTRYMVLLSMFTILLSKLSSQEDIIIGSPVAGRRHSDLEKIIGMFVNTLIMRNYPSGEKSFAEFLRELKRRALAAFENQEYPFEDLVERVAVYRDISRNPLFDVMFSLQNITGPSPLKSPGNGTRVHNKEGVQERLNQTDQPCHNRYQYTRTASKFDLTLTVQERNHRLMLHFTFNNALFKNETMEKIAGYFEKILEVITGQQDIRLSQLEMITTAERAQLLYDFNNTIDADYPADKTVYELFAEQAVRTPGGIAAVGPGSGENLAYLSFSALDLKSRQLGGLLAEKGIKADKIVAVMTGPSLVMVVGILGILSSGGCCLPIDPVNPGGRISYMLTDSQAALLLTHPQPGKAADLAGETLDIENHGLYNHNPLPHPKNSSPGDTVYMIYTSGTTGKPKGVLVKNENLVNYIAWFCKAAYLTGHDKGLLTSSFGFDLGYTSLYPPLAAGGQLHILSKEVYMLPGDLLDYIRCHRVSYLKLTPSFFAAIVSHPDFNRETCRYLSILVLGGEAIDAAEVEKAYHLCPHLRVINHYGPTEATIGCIAQFIVPGDMPNYKKRPTLGKPISNTSVFILDRYSQMLPVGTAGELCIRGAGLARGYLNKPELTHERFINYKLQNTNYKLQITNKKAHFGQMIDPRGDLLALEDTETTESDRFPNHHSTTPPRHHSPLIKKPARRAPSLTLNTNTLYRTGDLARWLDNGYIEFLGRIDHQVKIRGYRIEPGEIENQLHHHEKIKDAVVLVRIDNTGGKYLCAYLVPHRAGSFNPTELKEFLSRYLPVYMVPAYFKEISQVPLTANGKLDRSALPEPVFSSSQDYAAPGCETEEKLLDLWAKILGLEKNLISTTADFFQLGGHSLKATVLVSRIRSEFAAVVPLVEFFKHPTIRSLSAYIQRKTLETLTVDDRHLILLKAGVNSDRHLFFLHDGSGQVEGYIELCENLPPRFNYWGIRSDLLQNPAPCNCTIEELARTYLEKIKKVQPHGPYYLAGWSLGGTIAFEMALQAEQAGETVAFLGLFDSPGPPTDLEEPWNFNRESEVTWLRQYLPAGEIREITKAAKDIAETWALMINHLEESQVTVETLRQHITADLARIIPHYQRLGLRELIGHVNTNRTLTRARRFYQPSRQLNPPLHFFAAAHSPVRLLESWQEFCIERIRSYELPGDHFSIFKPPQAAQSAKITEQALDLKPAKAP